MDISSLKDEHLSRISPVVMALPDGCAVQEYYRRRHAFTPAAVFFNRPFLQALGGRARSQEQYDWLLDRRAEAASLIQQLADKA